MRLLLVFMGMLQLLTLSVADQPNYITSSEFEAVRNQKIVADNTTALNLPPANKESPPQGRPGFGPRLWTNAQVPYTLDPSFNANQRQQVALAIQAYHDATCIRFVPKQSQHTSWVNIRQDPNTCGVAHVCMNQGEQMAAFGGTCVSAGVMVHELGHTLCMGHEQTRRDRDEWIGFNTKVCQPHGKDGDDFNRGLHKLYDYVSVEHYEGECYNGCFIPKEPGVTKCGSGGPLSVLDIEILNEMYGCNSGCHGYRYVNIERNPGAMVPIGEEPSGDTLYNCRAYHQGDIIPGKYHAGWKQCFLPWNGGEHRKTGNRIEVLTNPNNVKFSWGGARRSSPPPNAIKGGRTNEREALYVIRCRINANGKTVWHPGKFQQSTGAYTSFGGGEMKCDNYEFLVCSW